MLCHNQQMISMGGVLEGVVRVPMCVSFAIKRGIFSKRMGMITSQRGGDGSRVMLRVHRRSVFSDAYNAVGGRKGSELGGPFKIEFVSEEGIDAGGLKKEFWMKMSEQMFDPEYGLFVRCLNGNTFQPSPLSSIFGNDTLDHYRFVGRMIGKALCDNQLVQAYFTRSFYKYILQMPLVFGDLEGIDPELFKSMKAVLSAEDASSLWLTFSRPVTELEEVKEVELKSGGELIGVTNENRGEWCMLFTEMRMYREIRSQLDAFCGGLYEVIPGSLLCLFDVNELELLISGLPCVDIDDMEKNTVYSNGYSSRSVEIKWFWSAVRSFKKMEVVGLVQFVTGTAQVPLGGFKNLTGSSGHGGKIEIQKTHVRENHLPVAHTCFNQLELPAYSSYNLLRQKLHQAITMCQEGFGLG
jgi:E3 ubiquitin-protein ligase HUWE1